MLNLGDISYKDKIDIFIYIYKMLLIKAKIGILFIDNISFIAFIPKKTC